MSIVVTDYEGKVVAWEGRGEEARRAGYNVNCFNCVGCRGCKDCMDCKYCTYCGKCMDCIDCTECYKCMDCIGNDNCTGCTNCNFCNSCNYCGNCSRCNECDGLSNGTNCKVQPIEIVSEGWTIVIRDNNTIKIGCQDHYVSVWEVIIKDPFKLTEIDTKAPKFKERWLPVIAAILDKKKEAKL